MQELVQLTWTQLNSSKLNKFFYSEVNLLIQHIIVQDQDGQNNNIKQIGINTRNWVDSGLERDYWRALVNAELNLRIPQAMELVCHSKTTFVLLSMEPWAAAKKF